MQSVLRKYPFIILIVGAVIQILTGIPAAWGVFRKAAAQEYSFSNLQSTLVFSLIIAFFGIGCVLGGYLQDKKGPRLAALCGAVMLGLGFCSAGFLPKNGYIFCAAFSVPVGLGCAFLYPAVMSCAQKWYSCKKGLATGIIGGAVGASGAFLTFTGRYFINLWGVRGAFLALGILFLIVCIPSALILENPQEKPQKSCGKNKSRSIKSVIKSKPYRLLFAIAAFATPAVLLFSPVIVELAQQRGLNENAAYMCIIIGSFFSAAGRLLLPYLSDKTSRRFSFMLAFILLCGFSAWFMAAKGFWVIIVYSLLTFCYSGEAAVLPAASTDYFGKEKSGVNYGFVALGMTAGSLVFPLLGQIFQNETYSHIIAIAASALGLWCAYLLPKASEIK